MNSLDVSIRNNKSKGDLSSLRLNGDVPSIIYGGTTENEKISISHLCFLAVECECLCRSEMYKRKTGLDCSS